MTDTMSNDQTDETVVSFLTLPQVAWVANGEFPVPYVIMSNRRRWRRSLIDTYLNDQRP